MTKPILLTPGPTPVPQVALDAMARPIIHHRTPQFQAVLKEVFEDLKYVFQTKNGVLLFTSSGTGAMEASVANLLSPGDKAIAVNGGKFGERWVELCRAYGAEVIEIPVEWGTAVKPSAIEETLRKNKDAKAVYVTLCETSTAALNDIKAIGAIVNKTPACLVVDVISGLGATEFKTDDWFVDIAVGGSQKGLMIPPGLAFCSVSPKAWALVGKCKSPRYYFDFKAAVEAAKDADTAYTPAVSLVIALNETLKIIRQRTLEGMIAYHKKISDALKETMRVLGLELYAALASGIPVTAVKVPAGVDGNKIVKIMRDTYGISVAGGQDALKGKIFRIASMGYITKDDVIRGIEVLEIVLEELGYKFTKGAGVNKIKELLKNV